jgi:holo-[acyl-carrier protein] synthase
VSVVAIGSDLASIARVRAVHRRHGERFARRLLTAAEWPRYARLRDPSAYLARRFAAKEAAAKALGTGIAGGVGFQQLEVLNDDAGAPMLSLRGEAALRAARLGVVRCHLSLTDERDYALAFVVLEGA